MTTERFDEARGYDGLKDRVLTFMRTYNLTLEQLAGFVGAEADLLANWFAGTAPPPKNLHTLLFSLKYPAQAPSFLLLRTSSQQADAAHEEGLKRVRAI
jgi:hypothetical protein